MNNKGILKFMGKAVRGTASTGREYVSRDIVLAVDELDEIMHEDGMVETRNAESLIPLHLGTKMSEKLDLTGIQEGDKVQFDLRITTRKSEKGYVYPELYIKSINRINQ